MFIERTGIIRILQRFCCRRTFMKIEQAIEELKKSKKRNFSQTYDMIVILRNLDLKKPENRFSKEVLLPHGRGKDVEVGIISDSIPQAILNKDSLNNIDKKT